MMALWRGMVGRRRKLAVVCAAMILGALMMVWASSKKTPELDSRSQISKSNDKKVIKINSVLPQVSKDHSNWLVGGEVPGMKNQTLSKQILKDSELINGDVKEVKTAASKSAKTQEVEDYELGEEMEEIDGNRPENKLESYDYDEGIVHPTGEAALELPPNDDEMYNNNAPVKVKHIRQDPVDTRQGLSHKSKVELDTVDIVPVKMDYTDVKQSKMNYLQTKDENNPMQDFGYSQKQNKVAIPPMTLVGDRQSKLTGTVDERNIDMKASFGKLKQSKLTGMKHNLARKNLKSVYGGTGALSRSDRFGKDEENDNVQERLRDPHNPGDILQGNLYNGNKKINGEKDTNTQLDPHDANKPKNSILGASVIEIDGKRFVDPKGLDTDHYENTAQQAKLEPYPRYMHTDDQVPLDQRQNDNTGSRLQEDRNAQVPQGFPGIPQNEAEQRNAVKHDRGLGNEGLGVKKDVKRPLGYRYNVNDIQFDLLPERDLCSKEVFIVIGICSAVNKFELREAIRNTWGSTAKNMRVKVVFVLGQPHDEYEELKSVITGESKMFGDILQLNLLDSYRSLSVKTLGFFKWANLHCPNAKFVMKTDDDIYLNFPPLLQELWHMMRQSHFILGHKIIGAKPITDRKDKWFMPREIYPHRTYPPYISGTAYVMPIEQSRALHKAAQGIELFWLEDIFITGILGEATNATLLNNPRFIFEKTNLMSPCSYKSAIAVHPVFPQQLSMLWTQLSRKDLQCTPESTHMKGRSL